MHKEILGKRKDLTGVRDADRVTILDIGSRVASLTGLERMQALDTLVCHGICATDLTPLSALEGLQSLMIHRLTGQRDYSPLEGLKALTYLYVEVDDLDAARSIARVDFSQLRRLVELRLLGDGLPQPVPIDLRGFAALPDLELLLLQGFSADAAGIELLARGAPRLEEVELSADDAALVPLRARGCNAEPYIPLAGTLLDRIFEEDSEPRFSIAIDVAGKWGLETNVEAELALQDELRARLPDVLHRIEFDTESSAVWINANRREDLELIQQIVEGSSKTRRGGE